MRVNPLTLLMLLLDMLRSTVAFIFPPVEEVKVRFPPVLMVRLDPKRFPALLIVPPVMLMTPADCIVIVLTLLINMFDPTRDVQLEIASPPELAEMLDTFVIATPLATPYTLFTFDKVIPVATPVTPVMLVIADPVPYATMSPQFVRLKLEKLTGAVAGYVLHAEALVMGVPLIRTDPPTKKFTLLAAVIDISKGPNGEFMMDDVYMASVPI